MLYTCIITDSSVFIRPNKKNKYKYRSTYKKCNENILFESYDNIIYIFEGFTSLDDNNI